MENFKTLPATLERTDNQSYAVLRDVAPGCAEELIARVENFEKMDYREQLMELQAIFDTLEDDNGNRFIAEYIAGKMYHIEVQAEKRAVAERKERMLMAKVTPEGYGGVTKIDAAEIKQSLSLAANDQRPPTPALARAG